MPAPCAGSIEKAHARKREYMRTKGMAVRAEKVSAGICRECSNPRVPDRTMCESCLAKGRERQKNYSRNLRPLRKRRGKCRDCGSKVEPNCSMCTKCLDIYRKKNREYHQKARGDGKCCTCRKAEASIGARCGGCFEKAKKKRISERRELMDAYGGKCACCGEANLGFLTIDHTGGNGRVHRQEVAGGSLYPWLKKNGYPQDGFQCLCYNCNCGRAKNSGVCPHAGQ